MLIIIFYYVLSLYVNKHYICLIVDLNIPCVVLTMQCKIGYAICARKPAGPKERRKDRFCTRQDKRVRLAEWSKAPDLSSGSRKRAWVRIPHLTNCFGLKNIFLNVHI